MSSTSARPRGVEIGRYDQLLPVRRDLCRPVQAKALQTPGNLMLIAGCYAQCAAAVIRLHEPGELSADDIVNEKDPS